MRVIHVAPTPFGVSGLLGGGERYPLELARALAPHIECELLTFASRAMEYQDPQGLRVRALRSVHRLRDHPAHPVAPALLTALHGADIIHTHHMRSTPSRIAALIGSLTRQHVVVTDHGLQGRDWGGILPLLFERFLAVSRYSAYELGAPASRTRIVYGGADPRRFRPQAEVVRSGVLFVGRMTPHKGVDRLIEALPAGAHLTVAGSTGHDSSLPEREYPLLLQRLARGRDVHFVGPVSDDDLPALYRQAAVLVLPSVRLSCYGREIRVSELLGLVVLEAMASGTPVICSRLGGLPEIVRDGVTGFLVEPGNVEQLRERIDQVVRDPALAERLGQHGRELVLEKFTWEACAQRCLEAYQELMEQRRVAGNRHSSPS